MNRRDLFVCVLLLALVAGLVFLQVSENHAAFQRCVDLGGKVIAHWTTGRTCVLGAL